MNDACVGQMKEVMMIIWRIHEHSYVVVQPKRSVFGLKIQTTIAFPSFILIHPGHHLIQRNSQAFTHPEYVRQ
jgi:hypothetical protein